MRLRYRLHEYWVESAGLAYLRVDRISNLWAEFSESRPRYLPVGGDGQGGQRVFHLRLRLYGRSLPLMAKSNMLETLILHTENQDDGGAVGMWMHRGSIRPFQYEVGDRVDRAIMRQAQLMAVETVRMGLGRPSRSIG